MKKVFKSVLTVTFIGVVTRLAGFVFKIILSRRLGAEGMGRLQICLTFLGTLFCLCSGGIPVTVSRKTALLKNDEKACAGYFTAALFTAGGLALLLSTVILLLKYRLSFVFSDERNVNLFLLLLPSLFAGSVYSVIRGWFWGKEKYNVFSLTEMLEEIARIILVITVFSLSAFSNKLYAVAISFTVADYLSLIVLTVLFFVYGGRIKRPQNYKELVTHSAPVTGERMLGAAISALVALFFPKLLVKCGATASEATSEYGRITAMAATFIFAPSTVTGAVSTVLVPKIAVMKENNPSAAKKTVDYAVSVCALIACVFTAVFSSLGTNITELFYNDVKAGKYLSFCSAVVVPLTLNGIIGSVINSIGKEKSGFINFTVGNTVFIVLALSLVKACGGYAYAIGQFCGSCVVFYLNCRVLSKEKVTDFSFVKTLIYCLAGTFLSSVFATALNVYLLASINKYVSLFISVSCIIVIYLGFLLLTKIVNVSYIKKNVSAFLKKPSTINNT